MKKARTVRISTAVSLAILAALAIASTAPAQVTVGQTAPATPFHCEFTGGFDEIQTSVAAGTSYVVPAPGGVITSWSTKTGPTPGQSLGMKVFRPVGVNSYQVVGHNGPHSLTPNTLNTFGVRIPVQAGDLIGTHVPSGVTTDCLFETLLSGDLIGYREGDTADGAPFEPEDDYTEYRLNLSATLLPPPVINSISPEAGSIMGASVVVTGANFASVRGVSFGSVPATSFTVDSEGQITAVAPPSATLSKVPLTVTTVAGTASSAQAFAYEGCRVPQLRGKKLKAAKKRARKANCRIGKVKKLGEATAKTGKVVKQRPKPGKILAPGAKINVSLKD